MAKKEHYRKQKFFCLLCQRESTTRSRNLVGTKYCQWCRQEQGKKYNAAKQREHYYRTTEEARNKKFALLLEEEEWLNGLSI